MIESVGNKIYECKPGNMPEDIIYDFDEHIPFITGNKPEDCEREFIKLSGGHSFRKLTNKGYSWCGHHPRYWREFTDVEKIRWNKIIFKIKQYFKK